jgi:hypothetical protein
MDCRISDSCPFSADCRVKDVAEFCAYHSNHVVFVSPNPPKEEKPICPVFPDCWYISLCNIPTQSQTCKNLSEPPPHPLPTPNSFNPYDPDADDGVFYLDNPPK